MFDGKEKAVSLHSQNNGNGAEENEGGCWAEVLWTNDPSKVWKVRVQEYEKTTLSIQAEESESAE